MKTLEKKARQLLAAATVGDDPAEERQAKRREMRIDALVELYEQEGCFIQRGKRQGMPMKALTKQYTIARLSRVVRDLESGRLRRFDSKPTSTLIARRQKRG